MASSQKAAQIALIAIVEVASGVLVLWMLFHILRGVFDFLGDLDLVALSIMGGIFVLVFLIALACSASVGTALIAGGIAVGVVLVFSLLDGM